MPTQLTGSNLANLQRHFRDEEHISDPDATQIIEDARIVFEQCLPAGTVGLSRGLIYGNIQSGKTAVILALIAIAADNGYQRFMVLTSDSNDLYDQTLGRTKHTLHGLAVLGKIEIKVPANAQSAPCVVVASKNVKVLRRLAAIVAHSTWSGQSVLMIDDEADQASLDTRLNDPAAGPSGVNREISRVRQACQALSFVQTTATPQALLLQDSGTAYRPDFVRVTTPGLSYCGGDVFFVNEDFNNPKYLRFVDQIDVQNMRTNGSLPASLEAALCGFFIAAAALRLRATPKNYQALVHTSLKQREHQLVTPLVNGVVLNIAVAVGEILGSSGAQLSTASDRIYRALQNAHADMSTQTPTGTIPDVPTVMKEIVGAIPSTAVMEINASTGQGVQSNPDRRHVIYVGGAKLGRGVTLKNLLMTYYARDAQSPQMDTVLQHARMYGYRREELPFTRIYLPPHLAERFLNIHRADNSMRDRALATGKAISVIPIPIRNLRPTRRSVLSTTSVELTTYIGGRQYYPLVPVSSGQPLVAQTAVLDTELGSLASNERQVYDISIDDVVRLLDGKTFGAQDAPGAWDDDLVRNAVELLRADPGYANQAQLIVGSRQSEVSKLATRGTTAQIQALLPGNAGNPAFQSRNDRPVLVFVRLKGLSTSGWDGMPLWVPLIQFPVGNYAFSLNRTA